MNDLGRYAIREQSYPDRTEVAVIDEISGEDCGSVRVYVDSHWPFADPHVGVQGTRSIGDPNLVSALGAMFERAAEILRAAR